MVYFLCLVLFSVGLYGIIVKRNAIKLILSLLICSYAVHLFFVLSGYKNQGIAPLFSAAVNHRTLVDPVPQALVMVSIIVSLAVTALLVTACLRLYSEYGTFDLKEIAGKNSRKAGEKRRAEKK